jgi:UDP-3-O-[3-hydroxymyristoyl] glucosamine N-acyltransferase
MVSGSPAFDNRTWLRAVTIFQRLPELLKRLDKVEKKLTAQEGTADESGRKE